MHRKRGDFYRTIARDAAGLAGFFFVGEYPVYAPGKKNTVKTPSFLAGVINPWHTIIIYPSERMLLLQPRGRRARPENFFLPACRARCRSRGKDVFPAVRRVRRQTGRIKLVF
jgi:hypothetical protein